MQELRSSAAGGAVDSGPSQELYGRDAQELAALRGRYENRLADIAELGHAIAELDAEVRCLRAQHEDDAMRLYVLAKLAPARIAFNVGLSQPFFYRSGKRARARLSREMKMVGESALFDAEWYLASYADLEEDGLDPLSHFVTHGAFELRNPGPGFDSLAYHSAYSDVTREGVPAFLHFIRNGQAEGRAPIPVGALRERP